MEAKTGSDIQKSFDAGFGLDSNGKKIPFSFKHPAQLQKNTQLYEKPDGTRIVDFQLPDNRHFKVEFSASLNGEDVGEIVFAGQMIYACETLALAQPIFQRGTKITQGGTIDIHFDDIIKARKVAQYLLGNTSGYDGNILDSANIARLKKDLQCLRREGDWATGDNDPTRAIRDFQELGIVDEGGNIDWYNFERVSDFIQREKSRGTVPEFESLYKYLQKIKGYYPYL